MNKVLVALAMTSAAMVATNASAATVVFDTTTNAPLSGASYANFNNRTLGSTTQTTGTGITVSFANGGAFVQGDALFQNAAPIVSNGNGANFAGQANGTDLTTYISTSMGSATLAFASPTTYFGLIWGSIDTYNTLTFNFADGTSQAVGGAATGFAGTGTSRYVNFTSVGSAITSVVASSSAKSFEFDNVAFLSAVPEPATWGMMILGIGMLGFSLRRRRSDVTTRVAFA